MNIIEALDDQNLFAPWFPGKTWNAWRAILKAAFALPMSPEEVGFFRSVADRDPPAERVQELWIIAGRRGGKDSIASVIAAHAAALFRESGQLRPGERALVMCLANDRSQGQIVLNYCRSYFTDIPLLQGMIERETAYGFELGNKIDIAVATNSFRAVRGRPVLCAILDEIAFWRDDSSATPDVETYKALKPGTATMPGSMIIGISSPYRKAGFESEVYDASLAASDAFQARKQELESSGRYTAAGIREELKKFNATLVAPVLEKAKTELQAANEALAARRSSIKPGTTEPKFSEIQRAEARAVLRTMPHKEMVSLLAGTEPDPLFVEAVLESRQQLLKISPALRAELERGALQKHHGPEIEELTEIESALTTAARAAQVAADDIALELREEPPQRPQLVRTA
ncbi:hypothetical protein [Bradyrhizobium sp. JYMT SZCCT0180]|uniref:hypothetical protein n=1 Tax=Bradyrhizobium sp. JYMT SZCCT0180 TaxID=2807666 RepID=UPI001BA7835E|nr:hypothetical protein [Bradyrhizobium sp. JYMT SZCCT0180]MBR1211112.1 hypothetical protein [Bradyrhizobium sp. JYMT SZCCT0180]